LIRYSFLAPPASAVTSTVSDAPGRENDWWKGKQLMQPRIDYRKHAQEALKSLYEVESQVASSGLEEKLLQLVRTRASQINGCAFCLDIHTIDARAAGETEQRLYTLNAWRETPFFSDRERAALAYTEAVTRVSETHVPDQVFEEAKKQFSEKEIVDLTLAVAMINLWNRVAISMRAVPGRYRPARSSATLSAIP
jgi:AhpD family alkylhydroperoxidase